MLREARWKSFGSGSTWNFQISKLRASCCFTSLLACFYPFRMAERRSHFATVEEAVEEIRNGRMIVLVDDEDRENEGDLTMAAEKITPEAINFMAKHGRGLICLTLTEQRCDDLHLPLMSPINTSVHGTAFCEAIDGRLGVTTGISASDRAITILTAIDPKTRPQDLARPGHIFPLRARNGGVLVRAGQTEASVDLSRIAGLNASGVICEIMNEDGTMARVPQLVEFCKQHNLKMLTVADLIRYRMQHERYVRRIAEAVLPTRYGSFRMIAYSSDVDHDQHVALVRGDLEGDTAPLVRVHSHCLTGDVFGSITCDCSELVSRSLETIAREDRGVFVYLHHTGRGFGIEVSEQPGVLPQIHFHSRGQLDREPARQRMVQHESGIGAQILIDLGLKDIRVLTNHPKKVVALEGYGIRIADQVPLRVEESRPSHQTF
jgi:3,4-dihydroxy 2-butanone 4-phosphate synthase / GTP cyclohydrolase II